MPEERPKPLEAVIFSTKAAVSAVVAVLVFNLTGLAGAGWAAVSAVIVSQPSIHPSLRASLTRVTANLIGACLGAGMSALLGHSLLSLACGVLVTGLVCHFLKLDEALRPAYAAVVIVIFSADTSGSVWAGSRDRMVSVVVGCLCALAVGFVFARTATLLNLPRAAPTSNQTGTE
jgi:uncharacterized membrane protein YgaE (UPF0421/DUF939 family)